MAGKIDKEVLKKQHFWLLLIPVAIGLLLAWIGLFFGVAEATDEKQKANETAKAEVDKATAQSRETLRLYDIRKEELFKLRTQRWQEMWNAQKGVYEWPKSLGDDQIAKVKELKFGAEISDDSFLNAFRDRYINEFDAVVADAAPVQFAGGWQAVLRPVAKWTRNPDSEDVWLACEDFWIEREMIRALVSVNQEAAKLTSKTDVKDGLRKRTFANRTWELNLQLVDKTNGVAVEGTIKNLTSRLQPFNITNELLFKIWLNDDPDAKPFLFAVEGTSQEAGKTETIKPVEKKHTVFEGSPRGLYRVEQVYDVRTAPVKRLDNLTFGRDQQRGLGLSARHGESELQMSAFSTKASEADAADASKSGGGTGAGFGAPPGMGGAPPGPGSAGVGTGPSGPGGASTTSPTDATYNGLARKRYLSRTDQVRAMPIGLTVIADQAYVQDVLTAVANCKLRFQTVQTHMARFRSGLVYAPGTGSGSNFGVGEGEHGTGGPMGPPKPGGPPMPGAPPGMGIPPGFPSSPGFPGTGFPGFPGFPGSGAPRSSNEDQVATNLVEIHMYGITTLYERFEAPTAKDNSASEPAKTDPVAPMPPVVPMPKDTTPTAPKDMTPTTPKDATPAGKDTTSVPPKK